MIVLGPATTTTAGELDSTVPWRPLNSTAPYPKATPIQSHDLWSHLGARPKISASSTPSQAVPWSVVSGGKHSDPTFSTFRSWFSSQVFSTIHSPSLRAVKRYPAPSPVLPAAHGPSLRAASLTS
ncbi:hypothetical protein SKAU_G00412500 [Synaphobranchus kaupii]|uniref:Uncharacterized protein n=1 Tax=Synaphobranchus kaupii TaxID=118154 RepID=A0A9Q1IBW7_SYNKA|nr:hypothetical protein SKAU_G00412500 [Synaphobranchus kaupii]